MNSTRGLHSTFVRPLQLPLLRRHIFGVDGIPYVPKNGHHPRYAKDLHNHLVADTVARPWLLTELKDEAAAGTTVPDP